MKVTVAAIKPTAAMLAAGCIQLTPEMLAATGARYSRNGEGVEAIVEATAGKTDDEAVDSIFRMVDYGHASIGDMVPVAMFMDRISMYLVMKIWQWCPTACGQETSTRYVSMHEMGTILDRPEYRLDSEDGSNCHGSVVGTSLIERSFSAYDRSLSLWTEIAALQPDLVGLDAAEQVLPPTPPMTERASLDKDLLKQMLKRDRLVRNFAFDRSRYYLPMGAYTNFMMVMSARSWTELIARLSSMALAEANELGVMLRDKLALVAPRLVKHTTASEPIRLMLQEDWNIVTEQWSSTGTDQDWNYVVPAPIFRAYHAAGVTPNFVERLCRHHGNRYTGFCEWLGQISVQFGWYCLPLAEVRDMNRHRPGSKYIPMVPYGFYAADDLRMLALKCGQQVEELKQLRSVGSDMINFALRNPDRHASVYWMPLGTQVYYSHTTTADKFLYLCELRTGRGAHPQYAKCVRQVLELWHTEYPGTREYVRPGTVDPAVIEAV